jgi:hypothetical protein
VNESRSIDLVESEERDFCHECLLTGRSGHLCTALGSLVNGGWGWRCKGFLYKAWSLEAVLPSYFHFGGGSDSKNQSYVQLRRTHRRTDVVYTDVMYSTVTTIRY